MFNRWDGFGNLNSECDQRRNDDMLRDNYNFQKQTEHESEHTKNKNLCKPGIYTMLCTHVCKLRAS